MADDPYHYTESGLPNVWLRGGVTRHTSPHGEGIAIPDLDGLHRQIGLALMRRFPPRYTWEERRFLRTEMGKSEAVMRYLVRAGGDFLSPWIVDWIYHATYLGWLDLDADEIVELRRRPMDAARLVFAHDGDQWRLEEENG